MRAFGTLLLAAIVLATAACASHPVEHRVAPAVSAGSEDGRPAPDAEAISAVIDPWEGFNRKIHRFNGVADKVVLRPVAVGYKKITPEPFQAGVSRFFANLGMPA